MQSVVVIGPGAVGATVATHLALALPGAVRVAARTAFSTLRVVVDGDVLEARVPVLTDHAEAVPADCILVAVKTYDAAGATEWLRALMHRHSVVAVLQNGVEHVERFETVVPREQILPVVVDMPAHRVSVGHTVQRGAGSLIVPRSENGGRFRRLFTDTTIAVTETDDFLTAAWTKLALNATGAITAATLMTHLELERPGIRAFVHRLIAEVVAVGQAEGANVDRQTIGTVMESLARSDQSHPNSLHADRLAGRPMEIDGRNGAVVRFGRRHGVPTPVNETLVDLLEAVSTTR